MFRRLSIALLVVTASVQLATAQRHGGFARGDMRSIGLHHGTRRFNQGIFPGSPYFYSDYGLTEPYGFDNSVQNDAESSPAQFMVVRPASAADSPRSSRPATLADRTAGRSLCAIRRSTRNTRPCNLRASRLCGTGNSGTTVIVRAEGAQRSTCRRTPARSAGLSRRPS